MRADGTRVEHHAASIDEQDIIDPLELQRVTRELLDRLMAMFSVEEAADVLRVLADGVEVEGGGS